MRLSALLLTLVIALGLTAPAEARTKNPKPPKAPKIHHKSSYKAQKPSHKPAKIKPVKHPKVQHMTNQHIKPQKPAKIRKVKPRKA